MGAHQHAAAHDDASQSASGNNQQHYDLLADSAHKDENTLFQGGLVPPVHPDAALGVFGMYTDGLACEGRKPIGRCFLSQAEPTTLKSRFQSRVNAALSAYIGAINAVGVQEMVNKEPEKADLFAEMLLDVIGVLLSRSAVRVFELLARPGEHVVDNITFSGENIASAGAESVKEAATIGITPVKKKAAAASAASEGVEAGTKKSSISTSSPFSRRRQVAGTRLFARTASEGRTTCC